MNISELHNLKNIIPHDWQQFGLALKLIRVKTSIEKIEEDCDDGFVMNLCTPTFQSNFRTLLD
jgi:hypothetical protein